MLPRHTTWMLIVAMVVATATAVTAEEGPDEPNPDDATSEDELLVAASSIADRVAEIRGLELQESIDKGVKDREQLREVLIERFHDEVPEDDFQYEALVYRRLGLFDDDLDYRELMLDLLTEQIAGFYDQDAAELYIMEGLPEAVQKPAMAHEIFHAIQDQHFDIGSLLEPFDSREHADFSLARMALIEGDATVLMIDYELYQHGVLPQNQARSIIDVPALAAVLMEMGLDELDAVESLEQPDALDTGADPLPSLTDSVLGQAPPIVRDPLLFPYVEGMRFVIRARSGRTWDEFDRVYLNPPVSTSQILHPERYFNGEQPVDVRFDALPALSDHERIYETTFGELKTRSWLNTHLEDITGAPSGADIASGWNGDRLHGYRGDDGDVVVVHLSSWRSEEEASDFAQTMDSILRRRHEAESAHRSGVHGESWCMRPTTAPEGQRHFVERWGEMVLYAEGIPSTLDNRHRETDPTAYRLRQSVWDSHRRVPFDEVLEYRNRVLEDAQGDIDDAIDPKAHSSDSQAPVPETRLECAG